MRRVLPGGLLICLLAGLMAGLGPASAGSQPPNDASRKTSGGGVVWLCKPGLAHNPCEISLRTTAQHTSGRDRVFTPARKPSSKRRVDCFYVYPTVSNQLAPTATKARDPEILSIAKYQASRFSTRCRMFAPVYRQVTLAGVATIAFNPQSKGYHDVVQAWHTYLRRYNHGRGVVLIGHSQGSIVLRELIRNEIDPEPALRRKLVGAVLLGGNVIVKKGKDVGGDFRHVPVCTERGEVGCVVAYSTYSTDPGPVSFFGNPTTDFTDGAVSGPSGAGYQIACTDPVRLSGRRQPLPVRVPSKPFAPGPINLGIFYSVNGDVPKARTAWVQPPDRFRGSCRTINGAHVFRYHPVGKQSRRPNEFPPTWGTHLFDLNLGVDNLLTIVGRQTKGWLAKQTR